MKRLLILPLLACAFLMNACGSESSLPVATGKATFRAINAMQTSPDIGFLIEEIVIDSIAYKTASRAPEYDDLSYRFNFEALFVGASSATRFASVNLDAVADTAYTFLLTGSVSSPTVTLFESPQRSFTDTETVFQTRFLHAAAVFGAVDVYFAAPGIAPVLGEEVASMSPGEMSDPIDFATGDYVLTLTAVGDPTSILHSSSTANIAAQNDLIVSLFDGDADDVSPLIALGSAASGGVISLADPSFLATMEFLHASIDLGSVDVYDDEALTSQFAAAVDFKGLTPAQDIPAGETTYSLTPAGDTSMVAAERLHVATNGLRYRLVAVGLGGDYTIVPIQLDRRAVDTAAKLLIFQTTFNNPFLDYYIVPAGETITDQTPFRALVASGLQNPAFGIAPGSFDLYVTATDSSEVIGGPLRLDGDFGDVFELIAYDTVDPAVVELEFLTAP